MSLLKALFYLLWILCLPNSIDQERFRRNCLNYPQHNPEQTGLTELVITFSTKKLNAGIEEDQNPAPPSILEQLVDGSGLYENANPLNVEFSTYRYGTWPYQGMFAEEITMTIRPDSVEVTISSKNHFPIEEHIVDDWKMNKPKEAATTYQLNEQFITSLVRLKANLSMSPFFKLGEQEFEMLSPLKWPAFYEVGFINSSLTSDQYNNIKKVATELYREIHSTWPYPNKDRKYIKLKALTELVTYARNYPYEPLSNHVATITQKYPEATLGKYSHRVANLLESLGDNQETIALVR